MDFRNERHLPFVTLVTMNSVAAFLSFFPARDLLFRIWLFLFGFYTLPTTEISLFPQGELRLFFIISCTAVGLLIGVVIGLTQWLLLYYSVPLSFRWVLLSTVSWLVSLPVVYGVFAVLHDLYGFRPLDLTFSFAPIYFIGGIVASMGEYLTLKIINFNFMDRS